MIKARKVLEIQGEEEVGKEESGELGIERNGGGGRRK
jgi:hypothetical protein